MDQLIIKPEEIARVLKTIDHPEFRQWVWQALREGELLLIAQGVIKAGRATTITEVLLYLAHYILKSEKSIRKKVTYGDIAKTSRNSVMIKKLSELLHGKQISKYYDRTNFYGVVGHSAIPELFTGNLIEIDWMMKSKKSHRWIY
jgi:hypothetical protein